MRITEEGEITFFPERSRDAVLVTRDADADPLRP
jgi:hypothetical protein